MTILVVDRVEEALDGAPAGSARSLQNRTPRRLVARNRPQHAGTPPGLAEELRKQADYFETNTHRIRYPAFREQGLFVGSGVIEAGCKAIVGVRLKQSGMFWTLRGANAIIALRC